MKIVCISDTHLVPPQPKIPAGDVLIHAGDHTIYGGFREIQMAGDKLRAQHGKFKHILAIAGNHDKLFEKDRETAMHAFGHGFDGLHYLQDESIVIDGVRFYGSPWTPAFFDWSFMLPRNSDELARKWHAIPDNTDVLITHGPPYGILDTTGRAYEEKRVGCELLADRVPQLEKLKLHVFGHIHHSYGKRQVGDTTFVNASICNEAYDATHAPIVIDLCLCACHNRRDGSDTCENLDCVMRLCGRQPNGEEAGRYPATGE